MDVDEPWADYVLNDVVVAHICPQCSALVPAGRVKIIAGPHEGEMIFYTRHHAMEHNRTEKQ